MSEYISNKSKMVAKYLKSTNFLSRSSEKRLEEFLNRPLDTFPSTISKSHQEYINCFPYLCHLSSICTSKKERVSKVLKRICSRINDANGTRSFGLSDLSLDLLAQRREKGELLSVETINLLDKMRPNGPNKK